MTKSFNKFKKPCFQSIFPPFSQFWGQKEFFSEDPALSCTTSYGFLSLLQNSEKTNDAIPRKRLDRKTNGRAEGWKDVQTLFYSTLSAIPEGPKMMKTIPLKS